MDLQAFPIVNVPLHDLRFSARNVRKSETKLEELAASIVSVGLLQGLVVVDTGDGFEVVAGKRRAGALELLRKDGRLPAGLDVVPCRVVPSDLAEEASLAENVIRESMNAADELEAFRGLQEKGASSEDIAQAFGVTPKAVERRLKLASVSPKIFEQFRGGKVTLEQMMALAVTDDHGAQEKAWSVREAYKREPRQLREVLLKTEIDIARDPPAKFVGVKALESAGVQIRKDLFDDKGKGFAAAGDRQKIDELALDLLEVEAEKLRGDWLWVEARVAFPYQDASAFQRIYAGSDPSLLTKGKAKELAKLESDLRAMYQDENDASDELEEDFYERRAELEQKADAIRDECEAFTAVQRKAAGVIVTIGDDGKLEIEKGYIRPGDVNPETNRSVKAKKKPNAGGISDSMVRRITAHRTIILAHELAKSPSVALRVVTHRLLLQIDRRARMRAMDYTHSGSSQSISLIEHKGPERLDREAPELESMPYATALKRLVKAEQQKAPKPAELLPWLFKQSDARVLQLLAIATALSIDAVAGVRKIDGGAIDPVVAALKLDFEKHWTPSRKAFLEHVPRAVIVAAVDEACGAAAGATLLGLKKEATIVKAEKLLAGKGWIPQILRATGAKKSAKKTAKKTAKRGAK